jgi:hypothetical protein
VGNHQIASTVIVAILRSPEGHKNQIGGGLSLRLTFQDVFSIHSSRSLNFLSFCNFVFTRITALLTELYRFNPKPAPTLIGGSERRDRIKYMATSRGSFSMPRRTEYRLTSDMIKHAGAANKGQS